MSDPSRPPRGLFGEFLAFLRHQKRWWLAPLVVIAVLIVLAVALGGGALSPELYRIF